MISKIGKYAFNGAIIFGFVNGLLNVVRQFNENNENPSWKFDWNRLLSSGAKGAAFGGVAGSILGAITDSNNAKLKRKNTDISLNRLADQVRLDKTSPKFVAVDEKAHYLSDIITKRFGRKLAGPPKRLGSTERGTALGSNFDIDLGFNFKAKSFPSTEAMRTRMIRFLETHVGRHSIIAVREQRNSIGVIFALESGNECKIDVVPIKLSVGSKSSGFLSTDTGALFGNSYTRKKTNFAILNSVKLSDTQKRIVILLKKWKERKEIPIGSHLLESLVLDAYKYSSSMPKGFTKKVIMVLRHIANNLDSATIRGKENSNNILTDITDDKKTLIIQACKQAIEEYEYQPNSIEDIFKNQT